MPKPSPFSAEQKAFLATYLTVYIEDRGARRKRSCLAKIDDAFFEKWPAVLPPGWAFNPDAEIEVKLSAEKGQEEDGQENEDAQDDPDDPDDGEKNEDDIGDAGQKASGAEKAPPRKKMRKMTEDEQREAALGSVILQTSKVGFISQSRVLFLTRSLLANNAFLPKYRHPRQVQGGESSGADGKDSRKEVRRGSAKETRVEEACKVYVP